MTAPRLTLPRRIELRHGDPSHFASLAHLHYRPTPPATCVQALAAIDRVTDETVGALVVSMPVLNARWRDAAFPPARGESAPRFRSGNRTLDARRLNAEVRTISRIVVDPRYRCLGVAAALVRRYLDHPLTPITESLAVMSAFSGFLRRAGMTPFPLLPTPHEHRLRDMLAELSIDPWMLADPDAIPASVRASPLLARELRRWANSSRATRRFVTSDSTTLLRHAAAIFHPPTAYIAVHDETNGEITRPHFSSGDSL